ncbi:MAG: AI-2E family transporter [Candidatus Margulisiibacteriota bacterium]
MKNYQKLAAIFVTVVILIFSFLIIRPFLVAILSAAALSYIFYPLYIRIHNVIPQTLPAKKIAAFLTCLIIILIVLFPTVILSFFLTKEIKEWYVFIQTSYNANGFPLNNLPFYSNWAGFIPQIKEVGVNAAGQLISVLQIVLKSIPNLVISILVTIFSTYYFLENAKGLYKIFSEVLPLPEGKYRQILKRFDDLSRGMIIGQISVGIIQGILAYAGFAFLSVPNPLLWGFLTALISSIPLLGAAMVWLPIDIYLFTIAVSTGNFFNPIALLIYGTCVISFIDNLIKPKIVGDQANIHPLIVLFGILGGIQLFGITGIIIGPLILALFDLVIEIFREAV